MSLLVVGTVAFDAIETPFGKTDKIVGGAATYIGLSASKFYNKINLVSVVGEDFPKTAIEMMRNSQINLDGLQIKKGEKTFFWSGKYHNDMNTRDTLDTQLNVLETFDPKVPEGYQDCKCLMLGNLMPAIQQKVLDQLKERPKLIVLDTMNFWMDIAMSDLKKTISLVDVLILNDEEARQLTGEYALVTAAKEILKMGPAYVIIKKGEHGALLFSANQMFFAPALPLAEVFDPTGAGDTFAGGFMGYIAASDDQSFDNMKRAVIYGSAMASFCVEKFGTERLLEINQTDINERVKAFNDLSSFDLKN